MYRIHKRCRACDSTDLISVADFGLSPLANDFKSEEEEHAGYYPLNVLFCPYCSLAQLSVVVNPEVLYKQYSYVSSTSETMTRHMDDLILDIRRECFGGIGTVLEIGSNTGVFLQRIEKYSACVQGIDPAENLADEAGMRGIDTVVGFFGSETASRCLKSDVIVARHVFAHIDDWKSFFRNLSLVASQKALAVIEVPYVGDMLKRCEWDSVYHEHLSYVSIRSINHLLERTDWALESVKHYDVHGGSIALFLRRKGESKKSVADDLFTEADFTSSSSEWKRRASVLWSEMTRGLGDRRFGYGAPAKATLWTSYLGITKDQVEFVHDDTPQKQGKMMPGTDIPVIDGRSRFNDFQTGIVFAWNYADEILKKEAGFKGKFVVPFSAKSV